MGTIENVIVLLTAVAIFALVVGPGNKPLVTLIDSIVNTMVGVTNLGNKAA